MNEMEKLFSDMNYLNLGELRSICEELKIPYRIFYKKEGRLRTTSAYDRKDVMLERIRSFLSTGVISDPTVLSAQVVNFTRLTTLPKETDPIYFGQYKNGNMDIDRLVKKLTGGKFRNGAIAYDVLRDYWLQGEAPSYKEFSKSWLKATAQHVQPKAEWAYLTDLASGCNMQEWKKLRKEKAASVIAYIKSRIQYRDKK